MIKEVYKIKYGKTEVKVSYFKPYIKFSSFSNYKEFTKELSMGISGLAVNITGDPNDTIQYKDDKGKLSSLKQGDFLVEFPSGLLCVYNLDDFMASFQKVI